MRYLKFIILIVLIAMLGCEDIYIAKLDKGNELLVVEARILAGESKNSVKLFKTVGFYETEAFLPIRGATIRLIDNNNNSLNFNENSEGEYSGNFNIAPYLQYKLIINYLGNTYESTYEHVPEIPDIDTIYGEIVNKPIVTTNSDGTSTLEDKQVIQLYVDIQNSDVPKYYNFFARSIQLYTYSFDTVMGTPVNLAKYLWKSFNPKGSYNIAAPNSYSSSNNINKHPVEFFNMAQKNVFIDSKTTAKPRGCIYIMHQYSIPVSAYSFYEKLNKQLESEGKIFDPIYTQAYGNIRCTSDKEKVILGNFEIVNYKEHRFFVKPEDFNNEFRLEKIRNFYNIPANGLRAIYPPDFWVF
jgi:hypothetical protein